MRRENHPISFSNRKNRSHTMVKYPPPKHPSISELRERTKEASARGLEPREALVCAMEELNRAYNPKTRRGSVSPWKKPPGFDQEWWNGRLLRVRLGVKPTKREVERAREKRARFAEMVWRTARGHTLSVQSRGKRVDCVSSARPRSIPLIKRKLLFSAFPSEEEANLEELLSKTSEAASSSPSRVVLSDEHFEDCLGCFFPGKDDVICTQSDKCLSVILSAKKV